MLEEVDAGTRSTLNLTIDDATVNHTTLATALPSEPRFILCGRKSGALLGRGVGSRRCKRCSDKQ